MTVRTCKRCGKSYHMLIAYDKARKDIRAYCPACHPFILAQIAERQNVGE